MKIVITPMPEKYRDIPKIFRPMHPPISFFQDCGPGEPTKEDCQIALEIFDALDPESRDWWGGESRRASLQKRIDAFEGGCDSLKNKNRF